MRVGVVRGAVLAGAAVAVGLTLAACASGEGASGDDASDGTAPSSPTPTASSPAPRPPIDDVTLAAGAVGDGLPAGTEEPDATGVPGAGWTAEDGLLYVVTYGSSTCPLVAEPDATVSASGSVVVTFVPLPDSPCTMDLVPTTSVVEVPSEVDAAAPVAVDLGEAGTVDVEPRPSAGTAGPIAWAAPPS